MTAEKHAKSPLRTRNTVFIRTVTNYFTGRIVGVTALEVLLEDAAWIAWTKRWSETLRTGACDAIEAYPDGVVSINRGAIVDVCTWPHALPRQSI